MKHTLDGRGYILIRYYLYITYINKVTLFKSFFFFIYSLPRTLVMDYQCAIMGYIVAGKGIFWAAQLICVL